MSEPFTIDQFKAALPEKLRSGVNPALVAQMTKVLSEPEMFETYRENLLSYTSVMKDGRFKLSNYLYAVKYVSLKLREMSNLQAFTATFPDKIAQWTRDGVAPKDMASYVTAYNKSKLVNLIYEQTMVPFHVLNQDLYQRALNVQAELMVTAASEKVRSDAANSLLTHLKPPETAKLEIDVTTNNRSIDALRQAALELVAAQRLAIQSGAKSVQEVAHDRVVIDNESGQPV